MKKYLILVLALFLSSAINAQKWQKNLPVDKVQNQSLTYFDIINAFESYWSEFNVVNGYYEKDGVQRKAAGWKQFKRWEYYWSSRVNPTTGEFPATTASDVMKQYQALNIPNMGANKSPSGTWTSIGPSSTSGGYAGLGRLNCVAFHPASTSTIYVGAASGGIWKTIDGGANWVPIGDFNDVIGVSSIIVQNTVFDDILYIATGDRDGGSMWALSGGQYNDNNSVGVLKSTDGGATWNTTGLSWSASQQRTVNRLIQVPSSLSTLYAATSDGLYKTTNGGTSWNKLTSTHFIDIEFKPGDPTIIHASTYGGDIYRSTNSGVSFSNVLTTSHARTELAVSANNASIVYAVVSSSNYGLAAIYKSTNSGGSYSTVYTPGGSNPNLLNWDCNNTADEGQAYYDLCIAADPTNANNVFVGGINTWKSTNGGTSWSNSTMWLSTCGTGSSEVHADKHDLAYQNNTSNLFECNDGGIYKTTNNGVSWTHLGSGLITSQLYRMGVGQSSVDLVIAGLQDNGTKALSGSWSDVRGGDGMECIIHPTNSNIRWGEVYYGTIYRTTSGGYLNSAISSAIARGEEGFWVTPFVLDPNNANTMYAGYQNIHKNSNATGGSSWTAVSSFGLSANNTIRNLAVAPSNSSYIYTSWFDRDGSDATQVQRTTNGGTSWSNITGTLPVGSALPTYISVKSNDPNTVWVSMGGYNSHGVYETTNGGSTWTNISTGLPSLPVMCVIENRQAAIKQLYAATDVGVYVKNGTAPWVAFNSGLPNVVVAELEIYYDDTTPDNSRLYAATFGRGVWKSDLLSVENEWTGADPINNYWDNPNNWSGGFLPSCYDDVEIEATDPAPIIRNLGNQCKSLDVVSGATVIMQNGSELEICGDLLISGNLTPGTSTITMKGTDAQSINTGTSSLFNLFIENISANVSLANNIDIDGDFTIISGATFDVVTYDMFVARNWSDNGTFLHQTSKVTFDGNTPSFIMSPPSVFVPSPFLQDDISIWPGIWSGDIGTTNGQYNQSFSNLAGGSAPEMRFLYSSSNPSISRVYLGPLNTVGINSLDVSFNHFVDDYSGTGYTLKLQYSVDGTNWFDGNWSINPPSDIGPQTINTSLNSNSNLVGDPSYYIAFVIEGNEYDIDYWYIDDVVIDAYYPSEYEEYFYDLEINKDAPAIIVTAANPNLVTVKNDLKITQGKLDVQ